MDSNSRVIQNQVHENDEHDPYNVDSQQVAHSEEKEVKSVFSKMKAKARKIKDTIKKHGHNVLDHGHNEDQHSSEASDDHALDKDEDQEVHEEPTHEIEAVRSAAPTSEKVENLGKSEVNFEATTTVKGEETHHKPQVVDVSPTTEIDQNITTGQGKTFVGEEKSEKPNVYLEVPKGLEEDPPKYNQTEVTDLTGTGTAEIDIAPVEKSFERINVQDKGEFVTETQSLPSGSGSLDQFVPDLYTATKTHYPSARSATPITEQVENLKNSGVNFGGTTVQGEEPHHEPRVVDVSPTTEINENIITDQDDTFVKEEKSEQPNVNLDRPTDLEEDFHGSGSIAEAYTPPEYHQTDVTDITGAGTEEIDIKPVEKSFERMNVQDELKHSPEPKILPNVTESQYPPAATGSHNQFVPEISPPTQIEDPSAESHDQEEYIPELPSAAKVKYPSAEIHDQFVPDFSSPTKTQYPSDGSHDQFDPETMSTTRMNVQDELKHSPEPKILPNVTESQYPPATGSHNQFVPEISTPTQIEDPSAESHDQEQCIPELNSAAKVKYPSDEIHDQFVQDFSTAAKTQYPSDGSHGQFDPETISTTRMNVQDELKHSPEPKVLPNVTETQYPPAATGSHNQFVPEISTPTQIEDPSAESHDQEQYIPELNSATKVKYPSDEIHDQFVQDFSTAAKTQYPSDGSHGQFDPETISTTRMNVQDELKHSPEPKVMPNVTETQYPPAATGSHNQFVPEISTPTQTEDPSTESHDQEQYIPELHSAAKVKYPSAEIHDQFVPDFSTAAKTQYPSDGSHGKFDPETMSTTRMNVQDELKHSPEPKVLPNVTETQYPPAATGGHNQFVPEISTPTQIEDPSAESHDQEQYIPELPSAAKVKYSSAELHDQFVPDFSTAAKTQYPSDGSDDQFDPETISTSTNRDHKISEATEQTFNTTTAEIEEQPSYEVVGKGEREDKEMIHEEEKISGDTSNKSGSTAAEYGKNISLSPTEKLDPVYGKVAEVGSPAKSKVSGTGAGANTAVETETENEAKEEKKGVSSVKAYLAEKLKPGEEDKALSEVISESLKKPKEESKKDSGDEEPEKVYEENSVTSPGKGVVDKLKGYVGSWFGKSEENPSTQGDEGLSQSENSGVEVEQVSKAKGEIRGQE